MAILNLLFAPLVLFLRNPPAKHQLLHNEELLGKHVAFISSIYTALSEAVFFHATIFDRKSKKE